MTRGGPPELSPADKIKREKGFVLDCVAVGTLSVDSESYNPKHATGIPPYNAQKDATVKSYFKSPVVKSALKRTGQVWSKYFYFGERKKNRHLKGERTLQEFEVNILMIFTIFFSKYSLHDSNFIQL